MVIKVIKPWKDQDRFYYAFDTESRGNYGIGKTPEKAEENLMERQKIKSQVLLEFNNLEIFMPDTREYMAGLISRHWEEIEEIRKEIRKDGA
jgi:hypothetical protein